MKRSQIIYLRIFVFTVGLIILVLELTASRLLAPYFGTSIFVWANIIGMILLALAIGYWLGGKIVDHRPEYPLLMRIVMIAGLAVAFIPFLFRLLAPVIINSLNKLDVTVIVSSFLMVLILFFFPALLLAMVSPFTVRLMNEGVKTTGSTAGSLYAWSTAGSILGTFVTAFVAVPFLGTQLTIYISSGVLIMLGVVGLKKLPSAALLLIPFVLSGLVSLYSNSGGHWIRHRPGIIYEKESPYQFIQVTQVDNEINMMTNNGFGMQSVYRTDALLTGLYYDMYAILPPVVKDSGENLDVLMIGIGGGTISNIYDRLYSDRYNLSITGVEIDEELIKAGNKYFNLSEQTININIADGRVYLQQNEEKYDIIIVDAFQNQLNIPFYLATQEFFLLASEHLTPGGVVALNFHAPSDQSRFLRTFSETVASIFPDVYTVHKAETNNYLIMGSHSDLNFKMPEYPDGIIKLAEEIVPNIALFQPNGGNVLTDDKAPVELLTESGYLQYL